ncbi:hypothetical protein ACMFMG_000129 [Clarireedia jacksonii]
MQSEKGRWWRTDDDSTNVQVEKAPKQYERILDEDDEKAYKEELEQEHKRMRRERIANKKAEEKLRRKAEKEIEKKRRREEKKLKRRRLKEEKKMEKKMEKERERKNEKLQKDFEDKSRLLDRQQREAQAIAAQALQKQMEKNEASMSKRRHSYGHQHIPSSVSGHDQRTQAEAAHILERRHQEVMRAQEELEARYARVREKEHEFDRKMEAKEQRLKEKTAADVRWVQGLEDRVAPTLQVSTGWRRFAYIMFGGAIVGLYIAVITGCTTNNLISRNLFTVNVFAGGAEEFLLPNFRVGYFGICSIDGDTTKCAPTLPFIYGTNKTASLVQNQLFNSSIDVDTANTILLAVSLQRVLFPLIIIPFGAFVVAWISSIWLIRSQKAFTLSLLTFASGNMSSTSGAISMAVSALQFITLRNGNSGEQLTKGVKLQVAQYILSGLNLSYAFVVGWFDKRDRRVAAEALYEERSREWDQEWRNEHRAGPTPVMVWGGNKGYV